MRGKWHLSSETSPAGAFFVGPWQRRLNASPGALSLMAMRASLLLAAAVRGPILTGLMAGGLFLPGAPAARAQAPLPPRAPVTQLEMGFDLSQGVVRLDVDLGSAHAAKLVFDTGNPSSTLDLDAARGFNLPLEAGQKKKMGAEADAPEYYLVKPDRVRLGSETLAGAAFAVAPLSKTLADRYGITCDGTLGYAAFKGRVLQLDYGTRKLRLLDSPPAATATAVPLPIRWLAFQKNAPPLVAVDHLRIGSRTFCAQVDTFFAGSLILFAGKLAGVEPVAARDVPATYYEGAKLSAGRLKEAAALGGAAFSAGEPIYVATKEARTPQTDIAAVLGNAFFHDSVLTLDFQNDRVLITPSHGAPQSDFPLRTDS